jgi:small subunit ribosomal protein S21
MSQPKDKKFKRQSCKLGNFIVGVKVIDGNIEGALKTLKTMVSDCGIVDELRDRQYFEKPSVVKRTKKIKADYKYNKLNYNEK